MKPGYTGISLTFKARDALRRYQARAGGVLLRRLTVSESLLLAVHIAEQHVQDVADVPADLLAVEEGDPR